MFMKKNFNFLVFVCVFVCLGNEAHAQNGAFLSAATGFALPTTIPSSQEVGADTIKHYYGPVLRIGFGGNHDFIRFNEQLGLGAEVAAGWYGNVKFSPLASQVKEATFSTLEFLPILTWHLKTVDLFTKLGGVRDSVNYTFNDERGSQSHTFNRLEGGVGCDYQIYDHVMATGEYLHIFGNGNDDFIAKAPTLNLFLVGVKAMFF